MSEESLTKTQLEQLEILRRSARNLAIQLKGKVASYETLEPLFKHFEILEWLEPQLIAAAKIGVDWKTDSSLEKWFPMTAEEIKKLREALGIAEFVRHDEDCYSQRTTPTTYSDPTASTCNCGLREAFVKYQEAIGKPATQT